jgi:hypothetical protein
MPKNLFIDELLRGVNDWLGLQKLSLLTYLLLVFTFNLTITLIFLALSIKSRNASNPKSKDDARAFRVPAPVIIVLISLNALLLVAGVITSAWTFHFSALLIAAIVLAPVITYLALFTDGAPPRLSGGLLMLAALVLFIFAARHIVNGIEEHETTSDMINIHLNGYFRWSIHGSHYDLAPLDAILKAMLSYITRDTIFSPILASAMYTCYGLAAFLLVYVLAKAIIGISSYALTITLLTMLSYPYSPIIGLSVPPSPHAHLLAVAALTFAMRPLLEHRTFRFSDYFAVIPLILASILMHPSSLGLVLYLALLTLWLAYRKSLTKCSYVLFILVFSLMVYFAKVMYSAFATGFANYMQVLWDYIVDAFREREITVFSTRNLGYSGVPRLCLTGFATLLGYLAGLALPILATILKKRLSIVEQLFMVTLVFYSAFALASVLTGLGGVSQSRAVLSGAQPYMELTLIIYLAMLMYKQNRPSILIPLTLSVLATLITPNAIPQNYTIPIAKPATLNDHIIAYKFSDLIDKSYYINLYTTCGDLGRIVASQERGNVSYGLGSTMASVYHFIAPKIVSAKSYWDPCIMAIYSKPRDTTSYIVNKVFDAWLYGFYIYIKG